MSRRLRRLGFRSVRRNGLGRCSPKFRLYLLSDQRCRESIYQLQQLALTLVFAFSHRSPRWSDGRLRFPLMPFPNGVRKGRT